jgi:hypothetical protein
MKSSIEELNKWKWNSCICFHLEFLIQQRKCISVYITKLNRAKYIARKNFDVDEDDISYLSCIPYYWQATGAVCAHRYVFISQVVR